MLRTQVTSFSGQYVHIYMTRTRFPPSCDSLPFQHTVVCASAIFCSTYEWPPKGGVTRSHYAQSTFLRDGNGRTIFSTGQHEVEALIRGATWLRGGRVYLQHQSACGRLCSCQKPRGTHGLKHASCAKTLKMCAHTKGVKICKACDSLNMFNIPYLPRNERPGRPKKVNRSMLFTKMCPHTSRRKFYD